MAVCLTHLSHTTTMTCKHALQCIIMDSSRLYTLTGPVTRKWCRIGGEWVKGGLWPGSGPQLVLLSNGVHQTLVQGHLFRWRWLEDALRDGHQRRSGADKVETVQSYKMLCLVWQCWENKTKKWSTYISSWASFFSRSGRPPLIITLLSLYRRERMSSSSICPKADRKLPVSLALRACCRCFHVTS